MTMPTDATEAVDSEGTNDGPRPQAVDTEHEAYVDEENVPHPGHENEH